VYNDSTNMRLGQVIQSMAKAAGFDVKLQPADAAANLQDGASGTFDMMTVAWSGRIDPDGNVTNLITTSGAINYSGVSDPGIDAPITQAAGETDVAQRAALYAKAVARQAELRGVIYLYHSEYYMGLNKDIAGMEYYEDGLPRFKTAGYAAESR
jgi:peptide/nickel transport system substrate-binding protein